MRLAVEMATAVVATAMMTAAAATTVTATMTAFRDRKVRHRQRHGEDNGGNSQSEF